MILATYTTNYHILIIKIQILFVFLSYRISTIDTHVYNIIALFCHLSRHRISIDYNK
jgi:hypothetical protein